MLGSRLLDRGNFTQRPAAVARGGEIELTSLGPQLSGTTDAGTVGNGGEGTSRQHQEKDAETRNVEAGWEEKVHGGGSASVSERDVSDYLEGIKGRF